MHEYDFRAVKAALDLAAFPSRCRRFRNASLPEGMSLLLRLAAEDKDAVEACARRIQASPQKLQEAAAFFIEQILLAPNVDSYRTLGAQRSATIAQLRLHLAYLWKWLHSGNCSEMARSAFILRVTRAWNNVKTPERRAAYDARSDARLKRPGPSRSDRVGAAEAASRESQGGGSISVRRARIPGPRKRERSNIWTWLIAFALGAWSIKYSTNRRRD